MSASLEALFAAARDDAPPRDVRTAVWNEVALATGAAAGVASSAVAARSSSVTTSPSAFASLDGVMAGTKGVVFAPATVSAGLVAKLLVAGAILGAVTTAICVSFANDEDPRAPSQVAAPAAFVAPPPTQGRFAEIAVRGRGPAEARAEREGVSARAAGGGNALVSPVGSGSASLSGDAGLVVRMSDLAQEARLVTEARSALVAGDAARALMLLSATRRLSVRALEPEELGLEARALRAMGRADEAVATDSTLRAKFPAHALAR